MKLNKKVTLGASALVVGATLIGGTMAWLTSEETIVNKFSTKSWDLEVDLEEDFTEDKAQDLLPGAEITKQGWVTNTKDLPVLVRVHIEQVWGDGGRNNSIYGNVMVNEELTKQAIEANVAIVDTALIGDGHIQHSNGIDLSADYQSEYKPGTPAFVKQGKWQKIGDYFYYVDVLSPEERTTNVISDVTINPNLTVEQHKQFGGKVFDINLKAQAVQIENDAYLSAWEISEETEENQAAIKVLVEKAINEYSTPEVPEEELEEVPTTPDVAE